MTTKPIEKCPKCGDENSIGVDNEYADWATLSVIMSCRNCDYRWVENYELISNCDLETGKEIE